MPKFLSRVLKDRDIDLLCKDYSTGDYVESRDYIVYLINN